MTARKPTNKTLEAVRQRGTAIHEKLKHKPTLAQLLSPEELADAAPFYFVLRKFIHTIKQERERVGLTLAEVSLRSGLAIESLSRLETGALTNPTWKTLGQYALAVGCRPCLDVDVLEPKTTPGVVTKPANGRLEIRNSAKIRRKGS